MQTEASAGTWERLPLGAHGGMEDMDSAARQPVGDVEFNENTWLYMLLCCGRQVGLADNRRQRRQPVIIRMGALGF